MIALNKETFDKIKKELMYIGILLIVLFIIFKIVYYKGSFIVSLRFAASLFWMFILPGYFIMFYWKEKLDFAERLVIGIGLSAAAIGIASYYIGLAGLNIKYHGIILPLMMILIGLIINFRK